MLLGVARARHVFVALLLRHNLAPLLIWVLPREVQPRDKRVPTNRTIPLRLFLMAAALIFPFLSNLVEAEVVVHIFIFIAALNFEIELLGNAHGVLPQLQVVVVLVWLVALDA